MKKLHVESEGLTWDFVEDDEFEYAFQIDPSGCLIVGKQNVAVEDGDAEIVLALASGYWQYAQYEEVEEDD